MRWVFLWLFGVAVAMSPALADEAVAQEFSGNGTTTTALFKVEDHWEVRWNARQVVSVAVMSKDGAIVAGAAGVLRGSLFVPLRGEYYLKISDGTIPVPAANAPAATTNASPFGTTNPPAAAETNAPPAIDSTPMPAETSASWHLQVVQLGTSVSASQALTVYTPFFVPPDSAITAGPTAPPPPPPVLTTEEAQAVVRIKGDRGQGFGFLVRTPDGTFAVTHLHLLEANPNVKVYTLAGVLIPSLAMKGATNRDLAMIAIKNDTHAYTPLPLPADDKLDAGEPLIIPHMTQLDPLLGRPGQVVGVTADRIDFDNHIRGTSAGAPVIMAKNGTALAVVSAADQVNLSDGIARAWSGNPAPGMARIFPTYGLRLTATQTWEPLDSQRYLAETSFLHDVHKTTRCLDSFVNGRPHRDRGENDENGVPDVKYFLNDPKLHRAFDSYKHLANDADQSQRMEASRELIVDLQASALSDVEKLRAMTSLYSYNVIRAREELAYRQAVRKQLDGLFNDARKFDKLADNRANPPEP